jgi:hypothetical protein
MSIFNIFNRKKYIRDYDLAVNVFSRERNIFKNGLNKYYYPNSNRLFTKFQVSNKKKNGEQIFYFESGEKKVVNNWKNGNQVGESLSFNKNGNLKSKRDHDSEEYVEYYNNGNVRFEFYHNKFKLYKLNGDHNFQISIQYKETLIIKNSIRPSKFLPINIESDEINYRNTKIFKNYNGEPWYGKRIKRKNYNGETEEILIECSNSNCVITFNYDGWFDLAYLTMWGNNDEKPSHKIIQITELNIGCISDSQTSIRRDDLNDKEPDFNDLVKFKDWDEFKGENKFISYSKDETCLIVLRLLTYLGGVRILANSDKIEEMIPGTSGKIFDINELIDEPQECKFEIPGKNKITIIVKFLGLVKEIDQNPVITLSPMLAKYRFLPDKKTTKIYDENLPNLGHNKYIIEIIGDISGCISNSENKNFGVA